MPTSRKSKKKSDNIKALKILIVDDHPILRQGLAGLIEQELDMEICAMAETAEETLEILKTVRPHLCVVDISLKGMSGIELTKEIKSRHPDTSVLILSMHEESAFAERAMRAGAGGYVKKRDAGQSVVGAIRKVIAGEVFLSPGLAENMVTHLVGMSAATDRLSIDQLSNRELETFELLGKGFSTREIAEKLKLSTKTIESYRERIKSKLNLKNGTQLLRRAIEWTKSFEDA